MDGSGWRIYTNVSDEMKVPHFEASKLNYIFVQIFLLYF